MYVLYMYMQITVKEGLLFEPVIMETLWIKY